MYEFDVEKQAEAVVDWTKKWFEGKGSTAIVGLSGGVDSTLTATICKKAGLSVIGVMMPCGVQKDIEDAKAVCDFLEIKPIVVNIGAAYNALTKEICEDDVTEQYETNTPARLRMTALYGISALTGGFVANTCNMSETFVGYDTLYGDSAGSFAPIARFTKTEVRALAKYFGVPEFLYNKVSIDGMSLNEDGTYKADEDKLGFSYAELDTVIRENPFTPNKEKIINKIKSASWKRSIINIEHYEPKLPEPLGYWW